MADGNPYIDELDTALKAAQPQQTAQPSTDAPIGTSLAPPAPSIPGLPDYQSELTTALKNVTIGTPQPEVAGPPFPQAPYDALNRAANAYSFGLGDRYKALVLAADRYHQGITPDFDYPQAYAEVKAGSEAYASAHPGMSLAADVTGTLVSPINKLYAPLKAASLPTKVAASTGAGGVIGGVSGALNAPSTSLDDILQSAKTGAELGAGTGAAFPVVGAVGSTIFPELSSEARILRAAGVQPTPGSAVGGLPGTAENLFSKIPIVGATVQQGRAQAVAQLDKAVATQLDTLNRNAVNEPLAIIGQSLDASTKTGHDAVAEMRTKLSDAFKAAVPTAGGALDAQVSSDIGNVVTNARLNPAQAKQLNDFVQTDLLGKVQGTTETDATSAANAATKARELADADLAAARDNSMRTPGPGSDANLARATQASQRASAAEAQAQTTLGNIQMGGKPFGTLSGQDFQDVDEKLGNEAHLYLKSQDPDQQKLGAAYDDLQGKLRDWLERVSPQNAADLQKANLAWRTAKPVLAASRATLDPEGIFTTRQLTAGVRANSTIPQFATGTALMQPFASEAERQRQTLATAGTSLKAASRGHGAEEGAGVTGGLLGAGLLEYGPEMLHHPLLATTAAVAYPSLMGVYSNPGRWATTGLLGAAGTIPPTIGALGPAAAQLAPQYAPVTVPYASGLLNPQR